MLRHWRGGRLRRGLVLLRPLLERKTVPPGWFGHRYLEEMAEQAVDRLGNLPLVDLWPLGGYCSRREHHDRALAFFEEAQRRQGFPRRLPGWAGLRLGWSLLRSGQLERAESWLRRLRKVRHKAPDFPVEYARLAATVQIERADANAAYRTLSSVFQQSLDRMSRTNLVLLLLLLGHLFRVQVGWWKAELVYDDVAKLLGRLPFQKGRYLLWQARGRLAVLQGRCEQAQEALSRARRHLARIDRDDHRADFELLRAQVASLQGRASAAADSYLRVSVERRRRGLHLKEAQATLNAAAMLLRSGEWQELAQLHQAWAPSAILSLDSATAKVYYAHRLEWAWLCSDEASFHEWVGRWSQHGDRNFREHREAFTAVYDPSAAPWGIEEYRGTAQQALHLEDPALLRGAVMRWASGAVLGQGTGQIREADFSRKPHQGSNPHIELSALLDLVRIPFAIPGADAEAAVRPLLRRVNPVSVVHVAAFLTAMRLDVRRQRLGRWVVQRLRVLPPAYRSLVEARSDVQAARFQLSHRVTDSAGHALPSQYNGYQQQAQLAARKLVSSRSKPRRRLRTTK